MSENLIDIEIKPYGVFRTYLKQSLILKIPINSNLFFLKKCLLKHESLCNLDIKDLIFCSVFANGNEILSDNYLLNTNIKIYILPPVSGG